MRIETNAIAATTKIRAEVQRDIDSAIRSKKDAEYKSQLAKQRAAERSKVYLLLNKNKNKSKVRISKKELQTETKGTRGAEHAYSKTWQIQDFRIVPK